jgi:hypothetical protein
MEQLRMPHNGVTRRVLRRKDPATGMLYDDSLRIGKKVSVLAMGGMILNTAPQAEVLNDLVDAGRIRIFGGSNWAIARMEEANAYARAHRKRGFELLSNNFSLADMVAPMWSGCISASDPESMAWLERTQTPIFAWSSQARGFFTDRAGRDKLDDPILVKCWYSDVNGRPIRRVVIFD